MSRLKNGIYTSCTGACIREEERRFGFETGEVVSMLAVECFDLRRTKRHSFYFVMQSIDAVIRAGIAQRRLEPDIGARSTHRRQEPVIKVWNHSRGLEPLTKGWNHSPRAGITHRGLEPLTGGWNHSLEAGTTHPGGWNHSPGATGHHRHSTFHHSALACSSLLGLASRGYADRSSMCTVRPRSIPYQ